MAAPTVRRSVIYPLDPAIFELIPWVKYGRIAGTQSTGSLCGRESPASSVPSRAITEWLYEKKRTFYTCWVIDSAEGEEPMPTTTQFVVSGQSKPGVLAEVAAVLGAAGVNIKAFSAPEVTGPGKLRLIVADVDAARIALRKSKIKFREETALILSLENKPGALKQVADSLTRARINVKCGYCTPSREGKRAIVVLTVSNTTKALGVLRTQSLDEF